MVKRFFFLCVSFTIIVMLFNGVISPQVAHSQTGDTFTPASIVKDINPGDDIANELGSHPRDFIQFNGNLYFVGRDREHGQELWKTDGTPESIKLVKDITPGIKDTDITGFTVLENSLYFFAKDNSQSAWGLWRSDGSVGGTLCIKDGLFISSGFGYKYPGFIPPIIYNGYLYFIAGIADPDSLLGFSTMSLWRSNGTSWGTLPVMAFADDVVSARLYAIDDTLYIGVSDGINGYLWKSDGTSAGTSQIYTHSDCPYFSSMAVFNNELFFLISSKWNEKSWLLKSDGTTAGTVEIKSFDFGQSGYFYNYGTKLIFFLASKEGTEMEAWMTEGNSKKTKRLVEMSGDTSFFPHVLAQLGDTVFFATHEEDGLIATSKLYKSDGTATGTSIIKDDLFPISAKIFKEVFFSWKKEITPTSG